MQTVAVGRGIYNLITFAEHAAHAITKTMCRHNISSAPMPKSDAFKPANDRMRSNSNQPINI